MVVEEAMEWVAVVVESATEWVDVVESVEWVAVVEWEVDCYKS